MMGAARRETGSGGILFPGTRLRRNHCVDASALGALVQRYGSPVFTRETRVRLPDALRWPKPKETRPRAVTPGETGASPVGQPTRAVRQPAEPHKLRRRGSTPRRATTYPGKEH